MSIEILCCYARKDQEYLKELKNHLHPLERQSRIKLWADTDINAGMKWEEEIKAHLDTANIILLLVSADFMKSEYCYGVELKRAIERDERGEARVIPILLRPVLWKVPPLNKLQVLPTNALHVTGWKNQEDAFLDITESILKVVEGLEGVSGASQKTKDMLLDREPKATYLKFNDLRLMLQLCYSIRQTYRDVILTFKNLTQKYPYQDIPDIRVLFFIVYPHRSCVALQCYIDNNGYFVNCKHRFTLDSSKQEKLGLVARAWNSQQIQDFSYIYEATEDKEAWLRESANFGFDRETIEHSKVRIASGVAFPIKACRIPSLGKEFPIVICLDSSKKSMFPKETHSTLYELISNLISDFNISRRSPLQCTSRDFANDTGGIINECND
jgi:hypothetical protein